jgi:hypothetical protein
MSSETQRFTRVGTNSLSPTAVDFVGWVTIWLLLNVRLGLRAGGVVALGSIVNRFTASLVSGAGLCLAMGDKTRCDPGPMNVTTGELVRSELGGIAFECLSVI